LKFNNQLRVLAEAVWECFEFIRWLKPAAINLLIAVPFMGRIARCNKLLASAKFQ